MRMTRLISIALVAVLALAGIAVAHKGGGQAQPTEAVQATFIATPTGNTKTRQCTGVDGTYDVTKGAYTGTSISDDPRLAGTITIRTTSVVNVDTGLGHTEGTVFLRDADTGSLKSTAALAAVNTERGVLNGFIAGKVKTASVAARAKKAGRGRGNGNGNANAGHHNHGNAGTSIAANFTAAFNADGSELSGELGAGTGQNTAVLYGNPCQPSERQASSQGDDARGNGRKHGGRKGDDDR